MLTKWIRIYLAHHNATTYINIHWKSRSFLFQLKPTPDADHLTLTDTEQLSVIGYGLVRAVDPHNKCLYITTPVSQSPGASQGTLDEINVIYKLNGNMTPERWIFNQISKVCNDF